MPRDRRARRAAADFRVLFCVMAALLGIARAALVADMRRASVYWCVRACARACVRFVSDLDAVSAACCVFDTYHWRIFWLLVGCLVVRLVVWLFGCLRSPGHARRVHLGARICGRGGVARALVSD